MSAAAVDMGGYWETQFIGFICTDRWRSTVARKCHSKQSKRSALKWRFLFWIQNFYPTSIDFILRQNCFPQIHSFSFGSSYGFKVSTPDPKFLLRCHSLLLRIQSYYARSKVSTPDPKFHTVDPKFLLRIQSYYSRSKVFTLDPKLLFRIQSY